MGQKRFTTPSDERSYRSAILRALEQFKRTKAGIDRSRPVTPPLTPDVQLKSNKRCHRTAQNPKK